MVPYCVPSKPHTHIKKYTHTLEHAHTHTQDTDHTLSPDHERTHTDSAGVQRRLCLSCSFFIHFTKEIHVQKPNYYVT